MFGGTARGVIVQVEPWNVHDQRNWRISWRPEDADQSEIRICHLAVESVHADPAPGDLVEVDLLMGEATEMRRAGRPSS